MKYVVTTCIFTDIKLDVIFYVKIRYQIYNHMTHSNNLIKKAGFSPNIKTYILLVVAFFLFISLAGIPLLIIWFLGFGQYFSKRYYQHLECQLTERHLEFKKGVLFKVEKTIPLENIQDLTFKTNPILQILDLKVLKVETAGNSNPQGMSDMRLVGITETETFKKMVLDQRAELIDKDKPGKRSADSEQTRLLTEIRDLLIEMKEK